MSKEKVDVRLPQNRCPYCHDDVEATASVACQGCLARHHGSCWGELGSCGSCGGTTQLQVSREALTRETVSSKLLAEGYTLQEIARLFGAGAEKNPSRLGPAVMGSVLTLAASLGAGLLVVSVLTRFFAVRTGHAVKFGLAGGLLCFGLMGVFLIWLLRRR